MILYLHTCCNKLLNITYSSGEHADVVPWPHFKAPLHNFTPPWGTVTHRWTRGGGGGGGVGVELDVFSVFLPPPSLPHLIWWSLQHRPDWSYWYIFGLFPCENHSIFLLSRHLSCKIHSMFCIFQFCFSHNIHILCCVFQNCFPHKIHTIFCIFSELFFPQDSHNISHIFKTVFLTRFTQYFVYFETVFPTRFTYYFLYFQDCFSHKF